MPFNPNNRPVQMYAGEGDITIEKNIENYTQDPAMMVKLYKNLATAYQQKEQEFKKLNNENTLLKQDRLKMLTDIGKRIKEWGQEKEKLEQANTNLKGDVNQFVKEVIDQKKYIQKIFDVLAGRPAKPGEYIKRIEDIESFMIIHWKAPKINYNGRDYLIPPIEETDPDLEKRIW